MRRRAFLAALVLTVVSLTATEVSAGMACYKYKYAPNLVRAVQRLLKEQGLYAGAVDGKWGPRTQAAVEKYQERHEIRFVTPKLAESQRGQLEGQTLQKMFGEDAPSGVTEIRNPYGAPDAMWAEECQ